MTPSIEPLSILSGKARAKVYEISELAELLAAVDAKATNVDAESVCRGVRRVANIINDLAMDALECPPIPDPSAWDNPT
ncbi:MAG: hypothetical protein WB816_01045 [Methylocystis sp.]